MASEDFPNNLFEIQDAPTSQSTIPLVLIHDGGGTVFNYFTIGPLHRQMFGISDPAFEHGADWKGWEGGLKQIAELYCDILRKHVGESKILLGGWSLGGLISLEMSRILAEDGDIAVQGLIMIDTPNFSATQGLESIATKDLPQVASSGSPRIRANVLASMERSQVLITGWQPPTWGSKKAPPAVLIRATDCVPVSEGVSIRALVDLARDYPKLGWEQYSDLDVISAVNVHDVHHFNMFSLVRKDDKMTPVIAKACELLASRPLPPDSA